MLAVPRPVASVATVEAAAISPAELVAAEQPLILRGAVAHWPLVAAGRRSPEAAMAYLAERHNGRPVTAFFGAPAIGGRFFYDEDVTGLNFEARRLPLEDAFDRIRATLGAIDAGSIYLGSTDVDGYFPGFRNENDLGLAPDAFGGPPPLVSIWIGNRTIAATHYDQSNNMACCLVGRRRFTLFPPDQIANLYPGPLEPTPGGQVVSMVDPRAPDLARFPGFADALAAARVAELEPGDLLFYPALWWHQVEALDPFNVMVNYWWNPSPGFLDTPQLTLLHAMLSLRDRPAAEKAAWRALFDYYVFGDPARPAAHLPAQARGPLAPLDELAARRLRAYLLQRLNR